jgi:hypothetical protein
VHGAYVVWRDPRNVITSSDVYAQALNASDGSPRWTLDGVLVCGAGQVQSQISAAADGHYGLLVAWQDARNTLVTNNDIFAQRIRPDGTRRWVTNGVQVCAYDSSQATPIVISDGVAGAIVAWTDGRSGRDWPDVYAQRVDSAGIVQWAANGIAVCSADSAQFVTTMIPDGLGGTIVGWDDQRRTGDYGDLYAQSVAPDGTLRWPAAGVQFATGNGTRRLSSSAPDGYGGALFAWQDFRNGVDFDIYGYRMTSVGTGVELQRVAKPANQLLPARPNPFNPNTVLEFTLGGPARFRLAIHDVRGRLVRILAEGQAPAGRSQFRWDGLTDHGTPCGSGVYYAVLTLPGETRTTSLALVR